jgi:hypothetical protein
MGGFWMSIWEKIKVGLARFMAGRRGADELSMAMLIGGALLSLLGTVLHTPVLSLLSMAIYIFTLFRMFSRNIEKRYAENAAFLKLWSGMISGIRQFFNRLKNMKKYKYFKCPECKSRLRLPRGVGEVTVTCGKCHHAFKQKA